MSWQFSYGGYAHLGNIASSAISFEHAEGPPGVQYTERFDSSDIARVLA
jgi:hypothetical protein